MSLWTRITGVVKFVTFYCFILCLIILHPRHTLNGWKYLEQSCVVESAFNQKEALLGAFSVIVKTDCGTDGSLHSTYLEQSK